jgi:hypothetical protein
MSAFAGAMMGMNCGSQLGAASSNYAMTKLQNEMRTESAKDAMDLDREILIRRRKEESRAYVQSNIDLQRRALEAESRANVSMGEAGIEGLSVDNVKSAIRRQEGQTRQRSKETFDSKLDTIDDSFERSLQAMLARMQGLTPPAQPNLLAIASQSFAPAIDSKMADSFDGWFDKTFSSTGAEGTPS